MRCQRLGSEQEFLEMIVNVSIDRVHTTDLSLLERFVQVRCTWTLELHKSSRPTCHSLDPWPDAPCQPIRVMN